MEESIYRGVVFGELERGKSLEMANDSFGHIASIEQRWQHAWLKRHKTFITRHFGKIAAPHLSGDPMIKTLEIFEPRAMQHQQNRHDFADAKAGRRSAWRGAVSEQISFPLRQKRLAKIVHCTEGFYQPFQPVDLPWQGWFGSIHRIIDSQCVNAANTRYRG